MPTFKENLEETTAYTRTLEGMLCEQGPRPASSMISGWITKHERRIQDLVDKYPIGQPYPEMKGKNYLTKLTY